MNYTKYLKALLKYTFLVVVAFCCSSPLEPLEQNEYLITFLLPKESYIKITIENNYSKNIRTVIDDYCAPGFYSETWDLKNKDGKKVYEGIYHILFYVDGELYSTKSILLRN